LILRIKELVQNRNIPPTDICYLTFIRAIAVAFRSDLQTKYPTPAEVESLRVNTVHSLALRIIRNTGFRIGLDGHLHIMNYADENDPLSRFAQDDLVALLAESTNIHSSPILRTSFLAIKSEWQHNRTQENLSNDGSLLFESYIRYSRAFRCLDWDELIPLASNLYSDEVNRPTWLHSLKHMLIDEYQDFNPAEQEFLSLLCTNSSSSVIVGDPDQSIYRGRGANPIGIRTLATNPNNSTISLVICRRCRQVILDAANRFLAFMNPTPRLLVPHKDGGSISVKSFPSCKAETDYLAGRLSEILTGINRETLSEDKPVCLFPSRRVLGQYRKEFEKRGIKCNLRGLSDTLNEKNWLRIYARLSFQRDQSFLHRILLERFPPLRRRIKSVVRMIIDGAVSVNLALDLLAQQAGWGLQSQTAADDYKTILSHITSGNPDLLLNAFNSVLPTSHQCTKENVETFLNAIDETNLDDSIDTLVSQVFKDETNAQEDAFRPEVELLTMHGSKGLTRKWIFIPGFEKAWMPGIATGVMLEELQRVFFVALTRATDEVCITYPRSRARGDVLNFPIEGRNQRSTFTNHIGVQQECLVYRR
jgi:ATP-dependent DNA helicase Rep